MLTWCKSIKFSFRYMYLVKWQITKWGLRTEDKIYKYRKSQDLTTSIAQSEEKKHYSNNKIQTIHNLLFQHVYILTVLISPNSCSIYKGLQSLEFQNYTCIIKTTNNDISVTKILQFWRLTAWYVYEEC